MLLDNFWLRLLSVISVHIFQPDPAFPMDGRVRDRLRMGYTKRPGGADIGRGFAILLGIAHS